MGINIGDLRISFSRFFSILTTFQANMKLTIFVGLLLSVIMATARPATLGEKIMQAAAEVAADAGELGEGLNEATVSEGNGKDESRRQEVPNSDEQAAPFSGLNHKHSAYSVLCSPGVCL